MNSKLKITVEEQKQIMLDILEFVHKFCKKNGLTYYLFGGSLIGAIRHHGFIPWDDDIDIGLLRRDYDSLLKTFNGNKSGKYELICDANNCKYYLPYAKIIDNRTILHEDVHGICDIGVNIDVFPLDYISDVTREHYKMICKRTLLEKIIGIKSMTITAKRNFIKNIVILLLRLVCPVPYRTLISIRQKKMERYTENNPTKWIASFYGAWGEREVIESDKIYYPVEVPFEHLLVNVPNGYDAWLTRVYGNYMQLPPPEKRVSHHGYTVYWK